MKRKPRWYFGVIALLFVITMSVLALFLYRAHGQATILVQEQFNEQQMLVARQTTGGIKGKIHFLVAQLNMLSRTLSVVDIDLQTARQTMGHVQSHLKKYHVTNIGLIDHQGTLRLALSAIPPEGVNLTNQKYFAAAKASKAQYPSFELVSVPDAGKETLYIAIGMSVLKDNEFVGVVVFIVEIAKLIEDSVPPLSENRICWVVDRSTTLLYHPQYKAGTTIGDLPKRDASFDGFVKAAGLGEAHQAQYISPAGSRMIAAAFSLEIGDQHWALVVAAPEKSVSKLLRSFSMDFGLAALVALLAIVASSMVVISLIQRWSRDLKSTVEERTRDLALSEDQLRESLHEKEMLLREIHHRVKNNMQVISSLLKYQSGFIQDPDSKNLFSECQDRVNSMAFIHENLYESGDLANINLRDYVTKLSGSLFHSFGMTGDRVKLKTEVADVLLGVDVAVPCGLIINELVSNALKHAFPKGRKGQVVITVRPAGEGGLELLVADDGVGIPENLDLEDTKTLGLHLVTNLVNHQLRGELEIRRSAGTLCRISFSKIDYKERL